MAITRMLSHIDAQIYHKCELHVDACVYSQSHMRLGGKHADTEHGSCIWSRAESERADRLPIDGVARRLLDNLEALVQVVGRCDEVVIELVGQGVESCALLHLLRTDNSAIALNVVVGADCAALAVWRGDGKTDDP